MSYWRTYIQLPLFFLLGIGCLSAQQATSTSVVPEPTKYVWQQPVIATATIATAFAGVSPFFIPYSQRQNIFIREEIQIFRRSHFDNRRFSFDNCIQYLPLSSNLVLNLVGVPSNHNFWQQSRRAATAWLISTVIIYPVKETLRCLRPDRSSYNSFPSGHTSTAFLGAELLRLEYGNTSSAIPIAGYSLALFVGTMRLYNDRHWTNDVVAGAVVGIMSANLSYWLNGCVETLYARHCKQRQDNTITVLEVY